MSLCLVTITTEELVKNSSSDLPKSQTEAFQKCQYSLNQLLKEQQQIIFSSNVYRIYYRLRVGKGLRFYLQLLSTNSGNSLDHTSCRWPSNRNLETAFHRAPSPFGAAYSLLTALMILKFSLVLIINMSPSNFYTLNLISSETSQNKLNLFLICQTFKYFKTGILEEVI